MIFLTIALLLTSFAATLFFKSITILVPVGFYLLDMVCICQCFLRNAPQVRFLVDNLHRTHPWIGMYLNTVRRKNNGYFLGLTILAMVVTAFIFYWFFDIMIHFCLGMLFPVTISYGQARGSFFYILYFEFLGTSMFRTRDSLYFGPKLIFLSFLCYFLYLNLVGCPLAGTSFLLNICFCFDVFFFCVQKFEVTAADLPNNDFNKPTATRPRALFQPLFSLTWYHDLPPLWSAFVPLYDRSHFTAAELSLVDRNYLLLQRHLGRRPEAAEPGPAGAEMEAAQDGEFGDLNI